MLFLLWGALGRSVLLGFLIVFGLSVSSCGFLFQMVFLFSFLIFCFKCDCFHLLLFPFVFLHFFSLLYTSFFIPVGIPLPIILCQVPACRCKQVPACRCKQVPACRCKQVPALLWCTLCASFFFVFWWVFVFRFFFFFDLLL